MPSHLLIIVSKTNKKLKVSIKEQLVLAHKLLNYEKDRLTAGEYSELNARRNTLAKLYKKHKTLKKRLESEELKEAFIRLRKLNETWNSKFGIFSNFIHVQVEEIILALFVIFSLKAFFLQPFRIPTGSMQPTLYGIHAQVLNVEDFPNPLIRLTQRLTHGRVYFNYVAKTDATVVNVRQYMKFKFLIRTDIKLSNGRVITLPISKSVLANDLRFKTNILYKAGDTIICGYVDTGDMVIVDKLSYHFRVPKRGEVFVFDTVGMTKLKQSNSGPADQQGGTNYIKRLVGIPGDTISIAPAGKLIVNGQEASEFGIQRVMQAKGLYAKNRGYQIPDKRYFNSYLANYFQERELYESKSNVDQQEYAAMGDNTLSSFDTRYWGGVPQHNLVGPGLFVLWPFFTENWGFIK